MESRTIKVCEILVPQIDRYGQSTTEHRYTWVLDDIEGVVHRVVHHIENAPQIGDIIEIITAERPDGRQHKNVWSERHAQVAYLVQRDRKELEKPVRMDRRPPGFE